MKKLWKQDIPPAEYVAVVPGRKGETMKDFRKRIVLENRGGIFLPGNLIRANTKDQWEEEWVCESEGYLSLGQWMEGRTPSLPEQLELLDRILLKIALCQEYLLDPTAMILDRNTIWVSTGESAEIRLRYQKGERRERKEMLDGLLREFMLLNRDPVASDHLQLIADRINHENPGLMKLQRMILQMAREWTVCGWIKKNRAL